jgi:hypothetical protein
MTPERKTKWIEDLHLYPKTKGHLKDKIGYCCLGVLCETQGAGFNIDPAEFFNIEAVWFEAKELDGADLTAGNELSYYGREYFGLSDEHHDALIALNDDCDSFGPVIEYIRKNI